MTASDIFGLIVRVTGFLLIVAALTYVVSVLLWLVLRLPTRPGATPMQLIAGGAVLLICGLVVLLLAKPITRLIYGGAIIQTDAVPVRGAELTSPPPVPIPPRSPPD